MSELDMENLRKFENAFRLKLGLEPLQVTGEVHEGSHGLGHESTHLDGREGIDHLVTHDEVSP